MHISYQKLVVFILVLFAQVAQAQERLVITPHMVVNISARGDEWVLFDDQKLTENYGCDIPQTDNIWNFYDAVWNGKFFYFPVEVVVDFGRTQQLTQLCLRKGGGPSANGLVKIYTSTNPTNWDLLLDHTPGGNECYDLNPLTTRYVKFTFTSTQAKIREIEFYNTTKNTPVCAPVPQGNQTSQACGSPRFYMEDFIGSNTNLDIPPAKANAVGFVRNYHGIFLTEGYDDPDYLGYPNNEYNWRPESGLMENFDYDYFFQGFQDIGVEAGNSIHRAPPYLTTFAYKTGDLDYTAAVPYRNGDISLGEFIKVTERKPFNERYYPIQIDMVADDPNMYVEFADIMYQFTGRYGSNANARNMKVAANNTARAGLGTVSYLENWNEPDKWWHKSSIENIEALDPWVEEQLGYFSPFEYAAMSSASYDGNGKTNGVENVVRTRYPNGHPSNAAPVGMQAADPNMKMVMAGLSELNTDYVRALMFWFEHHRPDIDFPFDVINFHDYSNDGRFGAPLGQNALSPEDYGLKEKLEAVVEFRDRYLPEIELWMSEFGYDSHPRSIQSADCTLYCNDCDSPECKEKFREIQGQWIVRSFLEIAAAGVDRAMVFNMRDGSPEASAGLYQTSGMTTYRGDRFKNKNSWYYVSTMKQTLEGTKFDPSYVHPDPNVRMYRFVDDCGGSEKTVYAIWSPTSRAGTNTPIRERYEVELGVDDATIVNLIDGDMDGVRSVLRRSGNGKMFVDVSELPKFIVIGDMKDDIIGCACDYIEYNVSGDANTRMLNDEQQLIGGPLCVEGDSMFTAWNARANQQAIFDLKANYDLNSLFIYSDTLAQGEVEIYYGEPNNWTLFNTWETRNITSYRWKVFDNFNLQTRYIRIKTLTDNALIHEVAFCGEQIGEISSCNDGRQNGDETGVDCGGSCPPCDISPECPIRLSSSMVFDEQGVPISKTSGAIALVDESNSESPTTAWVEPWSNNAVAYIDLGQNYRIDKIELYDGNGSGNFKVRAGKPNAATTLIDIETNAWPPQWREFNLNTETRYLTVIKGSGGAKINEIRVCGTPAGGGDATPTCTDGIQNGNETGIDCGGSCPACETADCTIPLSPNMFFEVDGQLTTRADGIAALADEQGQAIPSTPWVFPWYNNAEGYIDLGATYHLDSIYLYDGNGSGNFKVRPGRPSDRTIVFVDFETDAWPPQWRGFEFDVTTRYLTFRKGSGGSKINEIRLCGRRASGNEMPSTSTRLQAAIQPNPSSGQSVLQYELPTDTKVDIQLWNIAGQQVRTLRSAQQDAGYHRLQLDEQLPTGLYLIKIQTDATQQVIKWIVE